MEGALHIEIRAYPLFNHTNNGLFSLREDTFTEWLIGANASE
jgi:hypothetical protein